MARRLLATLLWFRSPDHRITRGPRRARFWRAGVVTRSPDIILVFMLIALSVMLTAQQPPPVQNVPVMDGGAGPCSVDLAVTDGNGKPLSATVKVHIAYGFAGIRKLDLEAGTNGDGKVRFKGLPVKVHNPPLEFHATKDDLTGLASYNPADECQAKHDIVMEKLPKTAAPQ